MPLQTLTSRTDLAALFDFWKLGTTRIFIPSSMIQTILFRLKNVLLLIPQMKLLREHNILLFLMGKMNCYTFISKLCTIFIL